MRYFYTHAPSIIKMFIMMFFLASSISCLGQNQDWSQVTKEEIKKMTQEELNDYKTWKKEQLSIEDKKARNIINKTKKTSESLNILRPENREEPIDKQKFANASNASKRIAKMNLLLESCSSKLLYLKLKQEPSEGDLRQIKELESKVEFLCNLLEESDCKN